MNRGNTVYLSLNCKVNGEDMTQGAYSEIELQINSYDSKSQIKKLLSAGEIEWGTITYLVNGETKTFTGYYVHLSQEETFMLSTGKASVQVRVMANDEVGGTKIQDSDVDKSLSNKVLGNEQSD